MSGTGRISAWVKESKAGKKFFAGKLQIPTELIQQVMQHGPNQYGQYELDFALFREDNPRSEKAPGYTGTIDMPYHLRQQQAAASPPPPPVAPPQARAPVPVAPAWQAPPARQSAPAPSDDDILDF